MSESPLTDSVDDYSFLTAIAWPENATREQVAESLSAATGMDSPTLHLLMGQPPPVIVGFVETTLARAGVQLLNRTGADAFACTLAEIEGLGPTLKVRELTVAHGQLELDLWRLGSAQIPIDDVLLLVKGSLSKTTSRTTTRAPLSGAVSPITYAPVEELIQIERSTQTSQKLDVHVRDGRIFQIDGDKFGYTILGAGRGHSDRENMESMFSLMRHFATNAVADDFFRLWRPPGAIRRFRLPLMKINNDDPSFAFYSRWVALMYRQMGVIG